MGMILAIIKIIAAFFLPTSLGLLIVSQLPPPIFGLKPDITVLAIVVWFLVVTVSLLFLDKVISVLLCPISALLKIPQKIHSNFSDIVTLIAITFIYSTISANLVGSLVGALVSIGTGGVIYGVTRIIDKC